MKNLLKLFPALLLCIFFYLNSYAQSNCITNKILLNTGRNPYTGNLIPIGQQDSMWKVISIQNTTGQPGYTMPYSPFVISAYGTWWNPVNSRYLNKTNTSNETGGPNNTSIEMSRHFTTLQDDSFKVKAYFSVDNFVSSFKIDGVNYFTSSSYTLSSNYTQQNLAINNSVIFLHQGCHDITVTYGNAYPSCCNNPTGIDIEGYIESKNGDSSLLKETCYQNIPPTLTANNNLNYCSGCNLICPNLSITSGYGCGNLTTAKVYFTSGYTVGQDTLQFIPLLGITSSFNNATGVLTLTGNANYSVWEQVLQTICYMSLVPNSANSFTTKNIVITLGDALFNPNNSHYYRLIDTGGLISWTSAKNASSISSYFGLQGYLANVTDTSENDFIVQLIHSNCWLGGNDSLQEGVWRWVTGCEGLENAGMGRIFTNQYGSCSGVTWLPYGGSFTNWAANQPDDCCVTGEDYLHTYANSDWNDFKNAGYCGSDEVYKYLIEYGCMPGDPVISINGNVTINIQSPIDSNFAQTICQGQSYMGYSTSGIYIDTFQNVYGCDSIRTLNLSVNSTSSSNSSVVICSSQTPYSWNGQSLSTSGTYSFITTNSIGCDSISALNLTVNPTSSSSNSLTLCSNQIPYFWNGQSLTSSGTYSFNTTNSFGCDSISTINLSVNPTSSSSTSVSVCSNQIPYSWNSQSLTTTGIYTFTTTNSVGCDSIASLNLTVNSISSSNNSITLCSNQLPYAWNGQSIITSGVYTFTSLNSSGCLNTDSLILTINSTASSATSAIECDSFTWHGTTYTFSGIYIDSSINSNGCLNTDTLFLSIHHSTSSSSIDTACDSYIWYGTTYTSSGMYIDSSTNANNCLNTDTLLLTIYNSTSSSITDTGCDFYVWNGLTYTSSGIYIDSSMNANNCFNTDTLVLTIHNTSSSSLTDTACDSYIWNGVTYTSSGIYIDSSSNVNGCLHTDTLSLIINYSTNSSFSNTACNSYNWNGTTYTTSGTYSDSSTNANGCSQVDSLVLIINFNSSSIDSITSCEQFNWNGTYYTSSGVYSYGPVPNGYGCDSIASLFLTIRNTSFSTTSKSICEGEIFEGHSASGIYSDTLINAAGCDSIYTLNLTVNKNPDINYVVSKSSPCKGDTITIQYSGAPLFTFQTNSSWYVSTLNSIQFVIDENAIVQALAIDENGCSSNSSYSIEPANCCTMFVPNAFSPNGDGLNDYFIVKQQGDIKLIDISIFNRWGERVFYSESTLGWDGKYKNIDQDLSTYYYLIKYTCGSNKFEYKKGDIHLIR